MSTIVSKTFDSREECQTQGPILVTGALVIIASAAPVVNKGPQCRQSLRESSIFDTRRREVPEEGAGQAPEKGLIRRFGPSAAGGAHNEKITAKPREAV